MKVCPVELCGASMRTQVVKEYDYQSLAVQAASNDYLPVYESLEVQGANWTCMNPYAQLPSHGN